MKKYLGKYRGKVENNIDPMQLGRVQVSVPSVLGDGKLSWAMPCVPYAGKGVGFFAVPPVKANIWVEFEGGNIDYPIWSGCFWGIGEVPAKPAIEQMKVFKTDSVTLTLSDVPGAGGFKIEVNPPGAALPASINLDSKGIEIKCEPANIKLMPALIKIEIPKSKVEISAAGINMEGALLNLKSETAANIDGTAVNIKGKTAANVEGSAVNIKGQAAANIDGSMVKINNSSMIIT